MIFPFDDVQTLNKTNTSKDTKTILEQVHRIKTHIVSKKHPALSISLCIFILNLELMYCKLENSFPSSRLKLSMTLSTKESSIYEYNRYQLEVRLDYL
jgi:hypothetical protein